MSDSTKNILIVEDNPDNSLLTEKILNYFGYATVVKSHGSAALQYCDRHHPDLILMDLSLPDIDGMEVTRLLRKKEGYEKTPIIAMTAHVMYKIKESSLEAGLDDFIAKPFLPNDLLTIIRKYLE